MRLALSHGRLAGLGHRSSIVVADMGRSVSVGVRSHPATFPSGGPGTRRWCFIRWRYSSLGSKFYFCLIPRDFGHDCGIRLLKGLRRHWSQEFAILLGAVSVWTGYRH